MRKRKDPWQVQFDAERAEWHQRLRVDELAGLSVVEAERIVVQAGGVFESYDLDDPNHFMLLDLGLNRVRAHVRDGLVVNADIG